jgi:hypothetical protein
VTTPPGKDWAVMTAVERFTVNDSGTATTTFTVTNLQDRPASVTAAITADDVASGWFTVEEPVRLVDAGNSVPFVVRVAAPPSAPAAEYAFHLVVYSSDRAPEENPTVSSRVVLEVPATPPRPRRSLKAILLAAGAAAVVTAVVIALAVLALRDPAPVAAPSPSATAVAVPNVIGETDVDGIIDRITGAGLVPLIKYRHSGSPDGAVAQDPDPSRSVAVGTPVEIVVAVVLTPPIEGSVTLQLEPQRLPPVPPDIPERVVARVDLAWQQAEPYVRSWRLLFLPHVCQGPDSDTIDLALFVSEALVVNTPELRTIRHYTPRAGGAAASPAYSCPGWAEAVFIEPLDDFGLPGPGMTVLIQPVLPNPQP